jgi:hypothetical protein
LQQVADARLAGLAVDVHREVVTLVEGRGAGPVARVPGVQELLEDPPPCGCVDRTRGGEHTVEVEQDSVESSG